MSDFHHHERRCARKPHTCIECECAIAPGTTYVHASSGVDGSVRAWSMCIGCDAWSQAFMEQLRQHNWSYYPPGDYGDHTYVLGSMWSAIAEFCEDHLEYSPRGRSLTHSFAFGRQMPIASADGMAL